MTEDTGRKNSFSRGAGRKLYPPARSLNTAFTCQLIAKARTRNWKQETGNFFVTLFIRPATLADLPAMMTLEKHAATAAHWSAEQYENLFHASGPGRVALVMQEESGLQGFVIARVVGEEWEIENIAIAGPARAGVGWARVCWVSFWIWPEREAPSRYFWKFANPTMRRGLCTRSGRFWKAGVAGDTTKILRKTRFCIVLILLSLILPATPV